MKLHLVQLLMKSKTFSSNDCSCNSEGATVYDKTVNTGMLVVQFEMLLLYILTLGCSPPCKAV